jgi:prepilin-type N-terminal cleavage/methylation domain-containing protein/prepilin-type processing-associated H-X9-DG protein
MIRRSSVRKGFTLVELLVVITIIVVLAGIVFPVAMSMGEKGNEVKCNAQLGQLSKALLLYKQEKRKFPPYSGRKFVAALYRARIVKESKLYICPSSDQALSDTWVEDADEALSGKLTDDVPDEATTYAGRMNNPKDKMTIRSADRKGVPLSRVPVFCDGVYEADEGPETAHGDKIFIAFADGHVDSIDVVEELDGEPRLGEGTDHKYLKVMRYEE